MCDCLFLGSMIETLKSFRSSKADSPCFLLETNVGSTKKSASGKRTLQAYQIREHT